MQALRTLTEVQRRFPLPWIACAAVLFWAGQVHAYTWMIRHNYSGCATCHVDPSGAGLLTEYGRAQSELLLRTNYSKAKPEEAGEPAKFLWGVPEKIGPLPTWLSLGGSFRGAELRTTSSGLTDTRYLQMAADLYAQVTVGSFRANGSIGYLPKDIGPPLSALTHKKEDNLVSRLYWIGLDLQDQTWLLRAGRMNLPFGLRNVEHLSWVRSDTRTDINSQQQHGVSIAYTGDKLRGELMVILGNFQVHPDKFREQGYSGLVELSLGPGASAGVSSLVTQSSADLFLQVAQYRQAHGLFARYSPLKPLVLLAEADLLVSAPVNQDVQGGYAGLFQVDLEIIQGLHLMPMIEVEKPAAPGRSRSWREWGTLDWFFAPHADVRLDVVHRNNPDSLSLIAQLHVFL